MPSTKSYQIKEVARIAGVSVRTLHYYDEIGLLVPSDRSEAGYRLYEERDLLRLQSILIGRSLGLALEEIRKSLDDPDFDHAASLRRQRRQLVARVDDTRKMIAAIDATLGTLEAPHEPIDFRAIFDGFDPADYDEETRERWGDTDAYRESQRRTTSYTETDWKRLKAEMDELWSEAATAMRAGTPPDAEAAVQIVERYRMFVCRWFYDMTPQMLAGIAELWAVDVRYRTNIDKYGEGLADWLGKAVSAAAPATDSGETR